MASAARFQGQVAAITGAGSGMGRALARRLVQSGCSVAISDVDEDGLAATLAELDGLRAGTVQVKASQLDVADRHAVEAWAADTQQTFSRVNYVFNNAGVSVTGRVDVLRLEDFEWLMNINFWGVVHGTQAFLPYLRAANHGHIVNTASVFGIIAVPTQSAYNASKFAVRGFTEALRQELKDTEGDNHIGVSCVCPGGVKTNIVKRSRYVPQDNAAPTLDTMAASFEELAGLTSDQAADIILYGVVKNKARILVGKDAHAIALLHRLMPVRYPQVLAWLRDRRGDDDFPV